MIQQKFYKLICVILIVVSVIYCGLSASAVLQSPSNLVSRHVTSYKPGYLSGATLASDLVSDVYTVKSETTLGNIVDVIVKLDKEQSKKYFGPSDATTAPECSFVRSTLLDCNYFPVSADGLSLVGSYRIVAEKSYDGDGILSALRFRYLRSDGKGNDFRFQIETTNGLTTNYETTLENPDSAGGGSLEGGDIGGGDFVGGDGGDSSSESSSKPEIAALKPHLIIDAYSYGDAPVIAGQDFTLSFTLKNTSKTKKIENAIIVVSCSDDVAIKSTTNTMHVDEISPLGTVGNTVTLSLKVAAAEKVQTITIASKFQYHDKKETDPVDGEDSIVISVPSTKTHRAKITGVTPPKEILVDKEENIEFSVINNGFSTIYNMEAFIYDDQQNEIGWQFVGNVEGGTQPKTNKFPVTFDSGGMKNLKLVVQYETENLELMTMEREFQLVVEFPEDNMDTGFMPPPTELYPEEEFNMGDDIEGEKNTNYILIGGIGVVVVAAIVIIVVKIIRKKEDNFDDFFDVFPDSAPKIQSNVTVEKAPKKGTKSKKADRK